MSVHLSFRKKRDSPKTQSSVSKVLSCSLQIEEIELSSNRFTGNFVLDVFLPSLLKMNLGNNTLGPSCEIRNIAPCTHVDMRQNWFRHVSFLDCAHQVPSCSSKGLALVLMMVLAFVLTNKFSVGIFLVSFCLCWFRACPSTTCVNRVFKMFYGSDDTRYF